MATYSDEELLEMSDEDLTKLSESDVTEETDEASTKDSDEEESSSKDEEEASASSEADDEEITTDEDSDNDSDEEDSEEDQISSDTSTASDKKVEDKPAPKKEAETSSTNELDYKAEYERILQPFKANGRNIQVNSIDDAITLMRMGANYNKKMAALKPNLRTVKMLEQNNLNEEKINFAIDLLNGDQNAIRKLLKDKNIDPIDFDDQESVQYTPKNHNTVTDADVALDQVLNDIRDNESYPRTIGIVSKEWDDASRDMVMKDPTIIQVLDEHVQLGFYDKIADVLESERALGRLSGVPDLVAYKQIGDKLHEAGAFGPQNSTDTGAAQKSQEEVQDPNEEEARNSQRRAASPTRKAKAAKSKTEDPDFNPLDMSDEEFEKLSVPGLYR